MAGFDYKSILNFAGQDITALAISLIDRQISQIRLRIYLASESQQGIRLSGVFSLGMKNIAKKAMFFAKKRIDCFAFIVYNRRKRKSGGKLCIFTPTKT